MNLRRLTLFVRVVEEGGFSAASRALGVPKSALSQAVTQLERELGVKLLHRSSRGVTLTDAGATLHRRTAPALRTLDEAALEVVDQNGPLRGSIRMTAPVEVATRLLEPVLSEFLVMHPDVKLDLRLTGRVLDLVEEGIDLAVRGGATHDDSLVARPLRGQDAGLFAAPSYLARRGRPRRLADLARHDGVVAGTASASDGALRTSHVTWTLEGPRGVESVDVPVRLAVDQFGYLQRALASGVGIGLLPLFLAESERTRGALVHVLPRFAVRDTPLHLLSSSVRYLARPVAALRDHILAHLGRDE